MYKINTEDMRVGSYPISEKPFFSDFTFDSPQKKSRNKHRKKERKRIRRLKKKLKHQQKHLEEYRNLLAAPKPQTWLQKLGSTLICKAVDFIFGLLGNKYRQHDGNILVPRSGYQVRNNSDIAASFLIDSKGKH